MDINKLRFEHDVQKEEDMKKLKTFLRKYGKKNILEFVEGFDEDQDRIENLRIF